MCYNRAMKMFLRVISVLSIFFGMIGLPAAFGTFVPLPFPAALALFCVGGGYFLVCIGWNIASFFRFKKHILGASLEKEQERILTRRDEVRTDVLKAKNEVLHLIRLSDWYSASLLLSCFIMAAGATAMLQSVSATTVERFLAGCGFSFPLYIFFGFEAAMTFFSAPSPKRAARRNLLSREEFPLLYKTAQRAAEAVDFQGEFRLAAELERENYSVSEADGIAVSLPPLSTRILTQEELYQILLHEFAHVVHEDTALGHKFTDAEDRFRNHILLNFLKKMFFYALGERIGHEIEEYITFSSLLKEQLADEAAGIHGNAASGANAEAKSLLVDCCLSFNRRSLEYRMFESETAPTDYYHRLLPDVLEWIQENGERELGRLRRALPARTASHPTLGMRMKSLGVEECDHRTTETDENYLAETEKFLTYCDKAREEYRGWKEAREGNYLERKERMEQYEGGIRDEFMRLRVLYDYLTADKEKALSLAEEILQEEPENAQANYVKGVILFERDDAAAISHLRAAAEQDHELYDTYADACLDSGNEEIVQTMREEQPVIAQRVYDTLVKRYRFGSPSAKDIRPAALAENRIGRMKEVFTRLCKDTCVSVKLCSAEKDGSRYHFVCLFPKEKNEAFYKVADEVGTYLYALGKTEFTPLVPTGGIALAAKQHGTEMLDS